MDQATEPIKIDLDPDRQAKAWIKENGVRTSINYPAPPNCFDGCIDAIDRAGQLIQSLPDGEIKDATYFLFNLVNQACFERDIVDRDLAQWKQRADSIICELIKRTLIRPMNSISHFNARYCY